MTDHSTRIPIYRHHKGSGQALVQINGRRIYLGRYGSEESKERGCDRNPARGYAWNPW